MSSAVAIAAAFALAAVPACVTVSSPPYEGSSGGAGAGGTSSTVPICDRACQDDRVAYAIDNAGWLVYNQDVAGQPGGSVTRSASCPLSGTVDITGTVSSASNGITTTQLSFDLQNCGVAATTSTLTFTGILSMSGTFTSKTQNDITFSSSILIITGQLKVLDDPSIDESCPVSVTDTWDYNPASTTWLNGLVCGRNAGSGSSGSSGSSGTGGGASGSGSGGSGGGSSSSGGSTSSGGVTTCGNCPGQLECSTITGKCVVQSCVCSYVIDGSDGDSSWYLANNSCFMCRQNGLVTGDCSTAADAAAQTIVNCQ